MFNKITTNLKLIPNLWIITIPLYIIGLYSLYLFVSDFSYTKLALFVAGYIFFNIMGITAGLHRYFCHKSFKINKWKERLLLLAATTAGQGQPIFWVSLHRGYHHRYADTADDPHSPVHGFWHSIFLWKFRLKPDAISLKPAFELIRNKDVMFFSKHYRTIFLLFHSAILFISIDMFLYFSMLSIFVTLVTYNLTNSLNHIRALGYTNFKTKDNSTNVPWLWPFVLGECWHNNHHGRPGASHFGSKVSGKWWEFDPAGFFIELYKDRADSISTK